MTSIGNLGGTNAVAFAINGSGQSVGFATIAGNDHAFVYQDDNYLSARFWGDAYAFALRFGEMLEKP